MRSGIRTLTLLCLILISCPMLRSQTIADAGFVLKGVVKLNGKPAEGVALELKKNGHSIRKISTPHNGRYNLRMSVDDSDKTCEYILSISRDGVVPKTLSINTYVPRSDFQANPFSVYDFDLEIELIPTTVSDIVVEFPFGKIRWYSDQGAFALDQIYAKMIRKEETKLKEDPDKYLKELAEKRNKEESDKRTEEENRAKREAEQTVKPKVDEIVSNPPPPTTPAPPAEIPSNPPPGIEAKTPSADAAKVEKKIIETPGSRDASLENFRQMTDPVQKAQLAEARKKIRSEQIKFEKKKSANLSSKYESHNPITSLLDAADECNRHAQTPPKR